MLSPETEESEYQIDIGDEDVFTTPAGAVDQGRDYEKNSIVSLLLKLLSTDDIKNFKLSSNVKDFGAFDDIVLEIETSTDQTKEYAIQLKHKSGSQKLSTSSMFEKKRGFVIKKYFDQWKKDLRSKQLQMILFTNSKWDLEGQCLDFADDTATVKLKCKKLEADPLIDTSEIKSEKCCYKFDIEDQTVDEIYQQFFENFYVYTQQAKATQVKAVASKQFQHFFGCDNNDAFERFSRTVTEWYSHTGQKKKLDLEWTKRTIALCLLFPFVEPLSWSEKSDKIQVFKEAISNFDVTVVGDDKTKSIWDKSDLDVATFNKTKKKYNLAFLNCIADMNEMKDPDKAFMLWLLGECPLVVRQHPQVIKAIELSPVKKFVLLAETLQMKGVSVFHNLSNLDQNSEAFKKIVDNFECSLQGRESIKLKALLQDHGELASQITTDMLVTMLSETIVIGGRTEELPKPHIDRNLSTTVVDVKYLKKVEREDQKVLIVLSSEGRFDKVRSHVENFRLLKVEDFTKKPVNEKCLYWTDSECSQKTFDDICQVNKSIKHCHHFRVSGTGHLEWVKSKESIDDLEAFSSPNFHVAESRLYSSDPGNNINIICAKPGMGKSIMTKSIKNKLSSKFWTILIQPSDIASYFREGHQDFEEYINRKICKKLGSFDTAVMESFKRKGRVAYIWDGLDEISDHHFGEILTSIQKLASKGFLQWITARLHLQEKLEKKFKVFARTIQEFDEDQQNVYITERFSGTEIRDVPKVIKKIKYNIKMIQCDEVLGIPLQVYMLTELFRQDSAKYSQLLENVFSLTDLYEHFVDSKFDRFYKEKAKITEANDSLRQVLDGYRSSYLKKYEKAALKADPDLGMKINCEPFLKKIKEGSDGVGLIIEVSDNMNPTFLHNSYAEYFVACYFLKNYKKIPNLKEILFKERYAPVRFFFDLLMAKGCPAHIGVLYKNIDVLKRNEDKIGIKDKGGRSPLQLACAWGQYYPLLQTKAADDGDYQEISDNLGESITEEAPKTEDLLKYLLGKCDPFEEDDLFKMDSLSYADAALYLYPLIEMSKTGKVDFDKLVNYKDICTVLYYAIRFDRSHVFTSLRNIPLIRTQKRAQTLLHLCAEYNSKKCLQELLSQEEYRQLVNTGDMFEVPPIRIACKKGYKTILEMLLVHEADLSNICQFLEVACQNGHDEIIETLIRSSENIKADNRNMSSLMQKACRHGYDKIVSFLLKEGAKPDANSRNGTPLFIAAQYKHDKTVEVLIKGKANVDIPNKHGSTPLHISCQMNHLKIAKLLIEKANINATDRRQNTPLHAACKNTNEDLVQLLLTVPGIEVNKPNEKQMTPLHNACQLGSPTIVEMLIGAGAKVDRQCSAGRTPLHLACEEGQLEVVKVLMTHNVEIDVADKKGLRPVDLAQKGEGGKFREIIELLN